jgi:hypothetical protein
LIIQCGGMVVKAKMREIGLQIPTQKLIGMGNFEARTAEKTGITLP